MPDTLHPAADAAVVSALAQESKHAKASGHPVIASAEAGERWLFCYPDDAFGEY